MAFAPFTPSYTPEPTSCSPTGAKTGTRILQDWICDDSPWASSFTDLGIFACRDIFGGWCPNCDLDNLSAHASGRAGDSGCKVITGGNPAGAALANWLVANADILGIQEVIWNRRRWTNQTRQWRTYNGVSPHLDHVHWTQNASGARYLTLARIRSVAPHPAISTITHHDEETTMLYQAPGGSVLLLRGEKLVQIHGPTPTTADKTQLAAVQKALPPEARNIIKCNVKFWGRLQAAYTVIAA